MIEVTVRWFASSILPFWFIYYSQKLSSLFLHDYVYLLTACIHLFSGGKYLDRKKETPMAKGLGIYYVITYMGRGVAKIGSFSQCTIHNVR